MKQSAGGLILESRPWNFFLPAKDASDADLADENQQGSPLIPFELASFFIPNDTRGSMGRTREAKFSGAQKEWN